MLFSCPLLVVHTCIPTSSFLSFLSRFFSFFAPLSLLLLLLLQMLLCSSALQRTLVNMIKGLSNSFFPLSHNLGSKRKKFMIFFKKNYITLITRNPKGMSHYIMTCCRNLFKHLKICYQTKTNKEMSQHDFYFLINLMTFSQKRK